MELRKYELIVLSEKQEELFLRFLEDLGVGYSFSDRMRKDGRYNYVHVTASEEDHERILARKAHIRARIS
jgi:hypothetical protein